MTRTPEEQKAWELQAYGATQEDILAEKPDYDEDGFWAISILSDVQHLAEMHRTPERDETIRQWINKAKFFIGREYRAHRELQRKVSD